MFNKKYAFLVFFSLLICMVAVASVSAADNATLDDVASEEAAVENIAVDSQDDVVADDNEDVLESENQEIDNESTLASANDDELSVDDSKDVLSGSPSPNEYSVEFEKASYKWNWYDGETVYLDITPADQSYYYDFYFDVYDSGNNRIVHQNIYSGSYSDYEKYSEYYYKYVISAESEIFGPGTYTMQLVNYRNYDSDHYVFDSATLTVVDTITRANIKITQSGTYYNAKTISVQVTDTNGQAINGAKIKLTFSNGKTTTVTTNSAGKANYKVPFNAGSYTVKASPNSNALTANLKSLSFSIAKDNGKITITQSGKYATNKKLTIKVIDARTKKALKNQRVDLTFSNGKKTFVKTNSKGIATYNMKFNPGNYFVKATAKNANVKFSTTKLSNIKIAKTPVTLNPRALATPYASGKYFFIKVTDNARKNIGGVKLKVDIYTGSSKQSKYLKSVSTGWAKFAASKLSIGSHKIVVSVASTNLHVGAAKASNLIVKKALVKIYAPNSVNAYNQAGKYGVRLSNFASGQYLSGWTVHFKVYTGNSFKTFSAKTNANGYASITTKAFSKGKHTVVVTTDANNYYNAGSSTGSVTIVNKIPTHFDIDRSALRYWTITYYSGGYPIGTYISSVYVPVVLKDNLGHELVKPVKLTNSVETVTGTSGDTITMSGGSDITLKFAGDSKYMACTYVLSP